MAEESKSKRTDTDTWWERLIKERMDLREKLTILGVFLDGDRAHKVVGDDSYELLLHQEQTMLTYLRILDRRIARGIIPGPG